jgi:tetratricopeptide (TPR) repeat protein
MDLLIARGRLADLEHLMREILNDPRIDECGPSILLGAVYCQEGRALEAEGLIEARWDHLNKRGEGASEEAINLVRLHIELPRNTAPVEAIRVFLDQAARLAPDDDRIWLGRANLAIRVGASDLAERLLDSCLRRRPDDIPVWRARLNWAMAAGRVAEARKALKHLPAAESTSARVQELAAWFAAQRGDTESERRFLERLIVENPANFTALDRLVELTATVGQLDRAAELRHKKTAIERLQVRYQELYERNQPSRDAAEMARVALELGRWFEAMAFLTVTAAVDPDEGDCQSDLARIGHRAQHTNEPGRTLDEVLARVLVEATEVR